MRYLWVGLLSLTIISCSSLAAHDNFEPQPLPRGAQDDSAVKLGDCKPSAVPDSLRAEPYNLDLFYEKYCDAGGVPVIGSSSVSDVAIIQAVDRILGMSKTLHPSIIEAMIKNRTRMAIIAKTELTTDIPEHSDLNTAFPDTNWDTRTRGVGATPSRPAASASEENLLCMSDDGSFGEDIFVHEYAHTIYIMGLNGIDDVFEKKLNKAYNSAMSKGLWSNTYAATNLNEYWAEGVQSFYDVNQVPQDGIHNKIDTRAELRTYDRKLHDLIERHLNPDYVPTCPT